MSRPKKAGQGVRRLVTISQKNTAFLQWWAEQDSPSTSLALVLADWIERHGFVDVVNRPVRQLPRRSRPPASDERVGSDYGRGERVGSEGAASARDFLDDDAAGDLDEPRAPREPVGPVEPSRFVSYEQPEQAIPDDQGAPEPGPDGSDRADESPGRTPVALPVAAASHAEPAVPASDAALNDHRHGTRENTGSSENNAARALADGIPETVSPEAVISDTPVPETVSPEQFDMTSIFGH